VHQIFSRTTLRDLSGAASRRRGCSPSIRRLFCAPANRPLCRSNPCPRCRPTRRAPGAWQRSLWVLAERWTSGVTYTTLLSTSYGMQSC